MAIPIEIEARADALLKDAGLEDQVPVPLEKAAANLGYKCLGFSPDEATKDVSGVIDYATKQIFVNLNESLSRQRFTMAHEIAHAVLHPTEEGVVDLRQSIDVPKNQKEVEANQFAAALLMPRERFVKVWAESNGDLDMLASIFGASRSAIEIRAKNVVG